MCVVVAPIEIQCKEANFPRLVPVLPPLAITFFYRSSSGICISWFFLG